MMDKVRFFNKRVPDIDDVVMVRILDKTDYGYNVELLEYDNLKGLLPLTDLYKRRTRKSRKKRIIKSGEQYAVTVLNSDEDKFFVDVSIKRNNDEDVEKFQTEYIFYKKLNKIGTELFKAYRCYTSTRNIDPVDIEDIMNKTIWRLYENNGDNINPHDIYYNILINPSYLLNDSGLSDDFINFYNNNMTSRIIKKDMEMGVDLICLSLTEDGVETLKNVLDISDFNPERGYNINISILSPPKYKIIVSGQSKELCQSTLENVIEYIKNRIGNSNIKFNILKNFYVIKENVMDIKFLSDNRINNFNF